MPATTVVIPECGAERSRIAPRRRSTKRRAVRTSPRVAHARPAASEFVLERLAAELAFRRRNADETRRHRAGALIDEEGILRLVEASNIADPRPRTLAARRVRRRKRDRECAPLVR